MGPIRHSWAICNMVPCWTHIGKAIWELYGSSMGKINPHLSSRKKKTKQKKKTKKKQKNFHTFFTQMIISPQSQPIWWTVKVPTEGDLRRSASDRTCVQSRFLKDIGVFCLFFFFFSIIGNGDLMRIYIYLSILKVIGTYELK